MIGILKVSDLPKFNGTYFHIQKCQLLLFLTTKNLKEVVEGKKLRPSTPTPTCSQEPVHTPTSYTGNKQEWDTLNNNALSIIIACLENSQQLHVSSSTLASEAWSELSRLYESDDHHYKKPVFYLACKKTCSNIVLDKIGVYGDVT